MKVLVNIDDVIDHEWLKLLPKITRHAAEKQMKLEPADIRETANLIWGALDRVAREQGDGAASAAAVKNVHGNVAYLREALGDLAVIDLLGEIRETVLHSAMDKLRRV